MIECDRRLAIKYLCCFWLAIITPIFVIFPLMIVFGHRPPLYYLELALLRDFWTMFTTDPAPDVMDAL